MITGTKQNCICVRAEALKAYCLVYLKKGHFFYRMCYIYSLIVHYIQYRTKYLYTTTYPLSAW